MKSFSSIHLYFIYVTFINKNFSYLFLLYIHCTITFIQKILSELDTIFDQFKRDLGPNPLLVLRFCFHSLLQSPAKLLALLNGP